MPQAAVSLESLPAAGVAALRKLGADLATARKRRRQSLRDWAQRMGVSVPTLMRMEKGDSAVGMGVYVTALWLINRHQALAAVAEPKEDMGALEREVAEAARRSQRREPGERDV